MPYQPTGRPAGRPKGTFLTLHEASTRITARVPESLYARFQAYAEKAHLWEGSPDLSRVLRELLDEILTIKASAHTQPTANGTTAPRRKSVRQKPVHETGADAAAVKETAATPQTERVPVPPYDPMKHRLGKLCPREHDYHSTGQSLRYNTKAGGCLACDAEDAKARRQARRQKVSA